MAVIVVAGLLVWAEAVKGQSWFSGLMQTLFAIVVAVGLAFGLVVQGVGRLWPGARWGVLVAVGCVAMLAALIGLWLSL